MLILLSYDVPDNRRRTRLAHALKDFGKRVQYSVFECRLQPKQLDQLRERVRSLISPEEDSLRIYAFCRECEGRIESLGTGEVLLEDPDVYLL
ncbi:MAG TPA: CRISPR-associated endonuclease Cas2 [Thermoanaerobaculia bacterium]|nr:CRISPR-associated endonuclease Cas2 [Thermoanaerobaculia bacterium]